MSREFARRWAVVTADHSSHAECAPACNPEKSSPSPGSILPRCRLDSRGRFPGRLGACAIGKLAYHFDFPVMVARPPSFERSFGFILSDISRLARNEFERRVRDLRVTRAQWLVLMHLARRPGCTQSDLADAMQMQKITVSRHADRLVRAGWIQRRDHAEDGRAYHLYLSRKAQPVITRLAAVAEELRSEYMRGLSGVRRDALIDDLLHIKSNLLRMNGDSRRRTNEDN